MGSITSIDREHLEALAADYAALWGISLYVTDANGTFLFGDSDCGRHCSPACLEARKLAIDESLRWGEPTVELCGRDRLVWAAPLMHNAETVGALLACPDERMAFPDSGESPRVDVRVACQDLRLRAERANLTNAAFLATRREEYHRERRRAEAIHEFKRHPHYNLREVYLRDEPELIAAICNNNRSRAREILNLLLTAIHHHAGDRINLIKSFFMELVATICRTAVEAGGDPEELLGTNFANIVSLSHIETMEQLAPWLHEILERVADCIHRQRNRSSSVLLTSALDHMSAHCSEALSRDDVARQAHMSPSHFSRVIRRQTGRTFTELLTRIRMDRAARLLRETDRPLATVAMDSGFRDQSYFTKVFRRHMRQTPRQYRLANRDPRPATGEEMQPAANLTAIPLAQAH